MFIEKLLGYIYKEFKQMPEYKEVIRPLVKGSNAGNKKSLWIKKEHRDT